ncbi:MULTISPECIES: GAF domain-containing hybrid sensor histidine kinase/response regulator [unclassified Okeania]|uniref:hybrid sensor histidine kinase/response regulator n=1 Tax=unclassified Okeania TaxID=2634635 RepID=UPI00257D5EE8|nr:MULTISPECIES: GAF domain-containing hybrid sensor histidine kinase/response regulator [unclassified Okeania]
MAILSKITGDAQFPPAKPNLILPLNTLELLSQLLQQTTQGLKTILITEDILATTQSHKFPDLKFTVVISEEFNGLLWGTIVKESSDNQSQKTEDRQKDHNLQSNSSTFPFSRENVGNFKFNVGLTFDPEAITLFVYQIFNIIEEDNSNSALISQIKSQINNLKVNNPNLQDEFTLKLLKLLTSNENIDSILEQTSSQTIKKKKSYSQTSNLLSINDSIVGIYGLSGPDSILNNQQYPLVCKPIEQALNQQLEQEILLNKVTTQIRQSLELPEILSTTVEQVQKLIKVDRLLIYQFNYSLSLTNKTNNITTDNQRKGTVKYEALASEKISSVLGLSEGENCFFPPHNSIVKYSKTFVRAIADTEVVYGKFPCLVELMQQHQVKAKLVVSIIVNRQLWGLLIAHHCSIREWQDHEKIFLKEIAEHLAIAIYQAQLYEELQKQKQTLEKQVARRTQELYDTLQAAESANRTKSEFLATMSHELRTPLTCVIGISSTLLRWSYGNRGAKTIPIQKQRDYLQIIHDSGEHLLELINDILDLSQVEAGKAVLNIGDFSLSKLSYELWQTFREKAEKNEVKLTLEQTINPQLDLFTADQRRVKQILFNLLSNGIKFTPSGGSVILKVIRDKNTAIFQVEDTGIGISEEQKPLLFKKFQQLDSPYNRQQSGTGLGLALTKQLVELHGGIVEVESAIDFGSTFTVKLPAQPLTLKNEELKQKEEKSPNILSLQGSVVLIEQEEDIATVICDILTAAGLKVVWIIEGSTAVEQTILLQPLAVIVDMQLPGMDGVEIIQQLRTTNSSENPKILALTTFDQQIDMEYCYTVGADECLTKPINLEYLLSKMIDLLTK